MKTYEQIKVQIRLYEEDVIATSVVYDSTFGDYYMSDPFSEVGDTVGGGK